MTVSHLHMNNIHQLNHLMATLDDEVYRQIYSMVYSNVVVQLTQQMHALRRVINTMHAVMTDRTGANYDSSGLRIPVQQEYTNNDGQDYLDYDTVTYSIGDTFHYQLGPVVYSCLANEGRANLFETAGDNHYMTTLMVNDLFTNAKNFIFKELLKPKKPVSLLPVYRIGRWLKHGQPFETTSHWKLRRQPTQLERKILGGSPL